MDTLELSFLISNQYFKPELNFPILYSSQPRLLYKLPCKSTDDGQRSITPVNLVAYTCDPDPTKENQSRTPIFVYRHACLYDPSSSSFHPSIHPSVRTQSSSRIHRHRHTHLLPAIAAPLINPESEVLPPPPPQVSLHIHTCTYLAHTPKTYSLSSLRAYLLAESSYQPTYPKVDTTRPIGLHSLPLSRAKLPSQSSYQRTSLKLTSQHLPTFSLFGPNLPVRSSPNYKAPFPPFPPKKSNLRNHGRQTQRPGLGVHLQGRRLDTKTGRGG